MTIKHILANNITHFFKEHSVLQGTWPMTHKRHRPVFVALALHCPVGSSCGDFSFRWIAPVGWRCTSKCPLLCLRCSVHSSVGPYSISPKYAVWALWETGPVTVPNSTPADVHDKQLQTCSGRDVAKWKSEQQLLWLVNAIPMQVCESSKLTDM